MWVFLFNIEFKSFTGSIFHLQIQIGEISPSQEAFQSLLRYIYYGETKLPPQDALYLFQAPCFYGLSNNRLAAFCKYSLEHNITYENVLQTLEASDITKIYDIKDYALRLIVKDFTKVAHLPKIGGLSRELLLEIIRAVADSQGEFLTRISLNTDIWNLVLLWPALQLLMAWLQIAGGRSGSNASVLEEEERDGDEVLEGDQRSSSIVISEAVCDDCKCNCEYE